MPELDGQERAQVLAAWEKSAAYNARLVERWEVFAEALAALHDQVPTLGLPALRYLDDCLEWSVVDPVAEVGSPARISRWLTRAQAVADAIAAAYRRAETQCDERSEQNLHALQPDPAPADVSDEDAGIREDAADRAALIEDRSCR